MRGQIDERAKLEKIRFQIKKEALFNRVLLVFFIYSATGL